MHPAAHAGRGSGWQLRLEGEKVSKFKNNFETATGKVQSTALAQDRLAVTIVGTKLRIAVIAYSFWPRASHVKKPVVTSSASSGYSRHKNPGAAISRQAALGTAMA